MSTQTSYKSSKAREKALASYENVLAHWPVPYENRIVATRFGNTHIIDSNIFINKFPGGSMVSENKNLSKSAKMIQDSLSKKGLTCEVIELASSTRTANDAAATLKCTVAQIVKSLLFRTNNTNQPVLILVSGINRVNEKKIEELIGEKILKADADYTREITGFAIGGIPPLGQPAYVDVLNAPFPFCLVNNIDINHIKAFSKNIKSQLA